jgi:hypothetical protein
LARVELGLVEGEVKQAVHGGERGTVLGAEGLKDVVKMLE